MKKIAYLFVAFAFFSVIALSACKSKAPATPTKDTTTTAPVPTPDTAKVDTAVSK
jgi:hypothetical protein